MTISNMFFFLKTEKYDYRGSLGKPQGGGVFFSASLKIYMRYRIKTPPLQFPKILHRYRLAGKITMNV